jgi:predicted Zn-dependent protease
MLGQDKTKALCENVLRRAGDDVAEVSVMVIDEYLTRFANNSIHQNVAESDVTIRVRIFLGTREGMATTNRMDDAALDEVVARARASAEVSLENPEFPGLQGSIKFEYVQSFDEVTAEFSPEERAGAIREVCQLAAAKSFNAFGAFTTGTQEIALANTEGLFAYHMGSKTDFQTVVMEKDGDASGWARQSSWRVDDVPVVELGAEAIRKTEMGLSPQLIDPGEYTVVLDPYAVQDLIMSLNLYGMGARSVQEGRSWMVGRIGQQVFSPNVSIWDDGLDSNGVGLPFDFEGTPKKRLDIIKDGVVIGPVYDRATGQKDGKDSTGHALPANMRQFGPAAINLFMAPGDATLEEMIRTTAHGLYITRFHYTRLVHPSDCVVTGMTRDGAYLIENGKIAYPVKNLRFTQSYVEALGGVESIGKDTRLATVFGAVCLKVPALKLKSFNFTGSTV